VWQGKTDGPAHGLFLHHRHSRPIHLHIQDLNRLTDDNRQVQLHGSLNLHPLLRDDILSDRFRRALHGFGGHLQISQEFHLLTAMIERSFLAHDSLHAAYARRELRVFDVQFDIGGKLSGVTVWAQVVGTTDFDFADDR
jgi:hypothetical protein